MKKLIIVMAILVFVIPAYAAEYEVTFEWQQADADLPNLAQWTLYMFEAANPANVQAVNIPYTGGGNPFTSTDVFTIPGNAGSEVTRSFFATATGRNGIESAPSNTVSHTFVIPWDGVGAPTNLIIRGAVLVQ